MTNEIKEILDKLKNHIEGIRYANLTNYELRLLLDYITNLQDKLYFMIGRSDEKQEIIDKALEEINYMISNVDITEISGIKLKQILRGEGND